MYIRLHNNITNSTHIFVNYLLCGRIIIILLYSIRPVSCMGYTPWEKCFQIYIDKFLERVPDQSCLRITTRVREQQFSRSNSSDAF